MMTALKPGWGAGWGHRYGKRTFQLLALGLAGAGAWAAGEARTALDKYVAAPDPHYHYEQVREIPGKGFKTFVLDMTSQVWRTTNEVNRTEWKHWVVVVVPDRVEHSTSLLFISGGSNGKPAPTAPSREMTALAMQTRSVVTELKMVPNEPLTFSGEAEPRSEDGIIAYTWDKFLKTGDATWLARLPMTKSAVRAMDTVTEFCRKPEAGGHSIDHFVVAGGSKRGWTTWTTAAVDKRVVAIAPIVIDMLNLVPSFQHHFAAYGFYAPAVHDYQVMGIMDKMDHPRFAELCRIVEPYEYRDRLTMPKYLINATGDQFFLPDSSQFYFKDLPGVKHLRYVPNADHSQRGTDALEGLLSWYDGILNEKKLPQFSWSYDEGKRPALRVRTETEPLEVKLWQAENHDARDFRLETIGPAWTSQTLKPVGAGEYLGEVAVPEHGWKAFLVEMTFPNPGFPIPYKFTTAVKVVPDVLPFEKPAGDGIKRAGTDVAPGAGR